MMQLKGIIFDFNGVLWWDSHLQSQAWRQFSTTLRNRPLSNKEFEVHVHGRTNRHTMEYLTGRALTTDEVANLIQKKESIYQSLCLEEGANFQLSPGAEDLLEWLKKQNMPRTIATASEINNVTFFVEHLKLERWFDPVKIVYDDGSIAGKPAPDMYLRAAEYLGLAPPDCCVVEDSVSGIQSAHAAGIGMIFAIGPYEGHDRLARIPGVDYVIHELGQLTDEFFSGLNAG
jgi:HAD superfamily hydrolase (TIGR01509 family)